VSLIRIGLSHEHSHGPVISNTSYDKSVKILYDFKLADKQISHIKEHESFFILVLGAEWIREEIDSVFGFSNPISQISGTRVWFPSLETYKKD